MSLARAALLAALLLTGCARREEPSFPGAWRTLATLAVGERPDPAAPGAVQCISVHPPAALVRANGDIVAAWWERHAQRVDVKALPGGVTQTTPMDDPPYTLMWSVSVDGGHEWIAGRALSPKLTDVSTYTGYPPLIVEMPDQTVAIFAVVQPKEKYDPTRNQAMVAHTTASGDYIWTGAAPFGPPGGFLRRVAVEPDGAVVSVTIHAPDNRQPTAVFRRLKAGVWTDLNGQPAALGVRDFAKDPYEYDLTPRPLAAQPDGSRLFVDKRAVSWSASELRILRQDRSGQTRILPPLYGANTIVAAAPDHPLAFAYDHAECPAVTVAQFEPR